MLQRVLLDFLTIYAPSCRMAPLIQIFKLLLHLLGIIVYRVRNLPLKLKLSSQVVNVLALIFHLVYDRLVISDQFLPY